MKQNKFNNFTIHPCISSFVTQLKKGAFCLFKGQPVRKRGRDPLTLAPFRDDSYPEHPGEMDRRPGVRGCIWALPATVQARLYRLISGLVHNQRGTQSFACCR